MEVVNYKCPGCMAPLGFDIDAQKWVCEYCASAFTPGEVDLFDKKSESEKEQWVPEEFTDAETVAFTCPSCSGSVIADKNTASTFCAFCHAPTILSGRVSGEYRPAKLIPFKLKKDEVLVSMQKLCKNKLFMPKDFRDALNAGEITGLYVPFWLYSANIGAEFRATGKIVSTWSDSNYRYRKTDVYRVERDLDIQMRLVPVDASNRMDNSLMDALEPFDYKQMLDFSMEYLSGHFAESYDIDAKECYVRFEARGNQAATAAVGETTSKYTSLDGRSLKTNFDRKTNMYVMLPVWTLMTKYKDKTYYLAMNGQSGKSAGKLPLSYARVATVFSIVSAATALITFVGRLFL